MALPSSPPVFAEPDLPSSPPSLSIPPSITFGARRKRQHSEYGSCLSSDPVFSDTTSDAEQYDESEQPKRKKAIRGPWWSLGQHAGQSLRRSMAKESFRNADSGIWMGSDEQPSSDDILANQHKMQGLVMSDVETEVTSSARKPQGPKCMAAQMVERCLDAGQETVDLSDMGLTTISNEILRPLHGLIRPVHVDLTEPPSECEFGPLTPSLQLYLSRNALEILPPELFTLSNITVLSLRANRLTKLPAAISRLSSLKELNIAGNAISHLPWELLDMMHCRQFHRTINLRPNPFVDPTDLSGPSPLPAIEEPHKDDGASVDMMLNNMRAKYQEEGDWDIRAELELRLRVGRTIRKRALLDFDMDLDTEKICREELIYLASSTVQYFDINGMPMGRSQPDEHFAPVMEPTISEPTTAGSTSAPSMFELALRSLQAKFDLQGITPSILESMPPTVAAAMQKAGRNAGDYGKNETCSTCMKGFVIARAEWMEYWFSGFPSQDCLTRETVLPFLRKSCSWACARPSEVGEFRT